MTGQHRYTLGELRQLLDAASNPRSSSRTLRRLSRHKLVQIRARVARNPAASPELLRELADDPDRSVATAAMTNPANLGGR
jgi:hypothetical protein